MALRVPPVNAQLMRVTRYQYAGIDAYGTEIYADVTVWEGSASAYTTEKHEAVPVSGGGTTLSYVATIAIPSSLPVTVAPNDKLVYMRGGVEQTRVVDAVEDRADAGFDRCFVKDIG